MEINMGQELRRLFEMDIQDTLASDVRAAIGQKMDIQGVRWAQKEFSREGLRNARLNQFHIPESSTPIEESANYYNFYQHKARLTAMPIPTVGRCMMSTSKHDIYFPSGTTVYHWSALSLRSTPVLHMAYSENQQQNFPFQRLIYSQALHDNLLVVGDLRADQVTCKRLNRLGDSFSVKTWQQGEDSLYTHHIEIYKHLGESRFMASTSSTDAGSNCIVRHFNVETSELINQYSLPWRISHTSLSPDGSQCVMVGYDTKVLLIEPQSGQTIQSMSGHFNRCKSSAWHPDGHIFATGSDDKTCRLWDNRKLTDSLKVIKSKMASIESLAFSSDGKFMMMGEEFDFVHIYDACRFEKGQIIDFFGEVSDVSFSPDTQSLFIGVNNDITAYTSLLLYHRQRQTPYDDAF